MSVLIADPLVTGQLPTAELEPISLGELDAVASLQTRVDRKYVVPVSTATALLGELGHRLAVLDIDERRSFGYESVYFDTPEFDSYLGAARSRRTRFKVRTRTYLDSAAVMCEVKTRGPRGATDKKRWRHAGESPDRLDEQDRRRIDQLIGRGGVADRLAATMSTRYQRSTLVDLDDSARLTLDTGLVCTALAPGGGRVELRDRVIIETKSSSRVTAADRWLWRAGHRPEKISKYGTGLAALRPDLPSTKWNRTLRRHLG